jgi:hypothetical protein
MLWALSAFFNSAVRLSELIDSFHPLRESASSE